MKFLCMFFTFVLIVLIYLIVIICYMNYKNASKEKRICTVSWWLFFWHGGRFYFWFWIQSVYCPYSINTGARFKTRGGIQKESYIKGVFVVSIYCWSNVLGKEFPLKIKKYFHAIQFLLQVWWRVVTGYIQLHQEFLQWSVYMLVKSPSRRPTTLVEDFWGRSLMSKYLRSSVLPYVFLVN